MKILVLRGGALGDFVITLPALGLLRARWPEARIELVGNRRAAELGLRRHYLDAVYSQHESRWSGLGAGTLEASTPLGLWIAGFDLVVNFWPDHDGAIARDLRLLGFKPGGAPAGFVSSSPQTDAQPASRHFCAALKPLGLRATHFKPALFPNQADRDEAARLLSATAHDDQLVAWHPGSGAPRKNWPLPRWFEVIDSLFRAVDHRLVVILGESESGLGADPEFVRRLPKRSLVLRDTPPEHLAAVLARCRLFLGHDTGPAHVAAAVGCPCVLVFGPTDPAVWAPPHEHVQALRRGETTDAVRVAEVIAAVESARNRATRARTVMRGTGGR